MVFDLAEDVRIIDLIIKERKILFDFFLVAIPHIDDAVSFPDGVVPDVIPTDVSGRGFPICGNKSTLADLIKFKPVERALYAVILDIAQAERSSAMGALVHHTAKLGGTSTCAYGPMGSGKTTIIWHMTQLVNSIDPTSGRSRREIRIWRGRDPIDYWIYNAPANTLIYIHEDDNPTFAMDLSGDTISVPIIRYNDAAHLWKLINQNKFKLHVVYEPRNYIPSPILDNILEEIDASVKLPKRYKKSIFYFELIHQAINEKAGRDFISFFIDELDQIIPARPSSSLQYHLHEWLKEQIVDTRKRFISFYTCTHNFEDVDWRVMRKFQYKIWAAGSTPPKRGTKVKQTKTRLMQLGSYIIEGKGFGEFRAPPLPDVEHVLVKFR